MTRGLTAAACAATATALLIFLWKRRRAIINEILDALDDEREAELLDLWADGGWRISAAEARQVLALRVEFRKDAIAQLSLN